MVQAPSAPSATRETLRPIDDQVLVQREGGESRSQGGIVIPESAVGRSFVARVLALGPGRLTRDGRRVPIAGGALKVGDRVAIRRWKGTETRLGGEDVTVMREVDVLAVVEDGEGEDAEPIAVGEETAA